MVKHIHVVMDDQIYDEFVEMKGDLTWLEWLKSLLKTKEGEPIE